MQAIESTPILGQQVHCTGFCQPLASFENRVYEVEFDEPLKMPSDFPGAAVQSARPNRAVVKFYRPGRWNQDQILDEHEFMADLVQGEIPVVTPYYFEQSGDTLNLTPTDSDEDADQSLFYCVYPKVGGRQPEDLNIPQLHQLGRLIARMHGIGRSYGSDHRLRLNPEVYGESSLTYLKEYWATAQNEQGDPLARDHSIEERFSATVKQIIQISNQHFEGQSMQRIHGDCHSGNILWNEKNGPFFIDFDDMVVGPPVQDLWLLAPDPEKLKHLVDGYQQWSPLPTGSLNLIEPLRALRMIHYATWIAKRYNDPAFQQAFPQFRSPRYWQDLLRDLNEQLERMKGTVE
jgi:Ser/Thr protein kinase RdoA (MazF antagonist)